MTDSATFSAGGKDLSFPLVKATEGNDGYNISTLLKETGNVTLDTGLWDFSPTFGGPNAITSIETVLQPGRARLDDPRRWWAGTPVDPKPFLR